MLSECMADQAEGLRRLLQRSATRVITVAAAHPGMGATSMVVNLAAVFARDGKRVLVLDENLAHDNVSNTLALKPRYDFLHAIRRDRELHDVLLHPAPGIQVLPAARAMQALPELTATERESLLECLAASSQGIDVVLVDAAASGQRFISACMAPDQPLLLVVNASADAITGSYVLIKRMAVEDGRRRFGIVVNKARGENDAQTVFGNVARLAHRQLGVSMEYFGMVPFDEQMKRATQLCHPVVEVFPQGRGAEALAEIGRNLMLLPSAANECEKTGDLPAMVRRLIGQTRPLEIMVAR